MTTSRLLATLALSATVCWVAMTHPSKALAATDVTASTPMVGIGINRLSYWDQAFAMVDMTRESTFMTLDWTYNINPDANGAPACDFNQVLAAKRMGAGTYKLSFKGQATLRMKGWTADGTPNTPQVLNQVYDAATNTTTADVWVPQHLSGSAYLEYKATRRTAASTVGDGVTDIHLWRVGYAPNHTRYFTDEFIAAMQKVQVIRTMDFTWTNQNPSVHWAERNLMGLQGFAGDKGQAWELVVQLANETNRDIWINVPVKASDDYILKLAQLFRYGSDGVNPYTAPVANPVHPPLNAGLKVYVEYGNEIWNYGPGFYGFGWALELANLYRNNPAHPIAFDGPVADQYLALRRWVGYRSAFISETFRSVFGDSQMMSVVRPVLTAQAGNANDTLGLPLRWADAFYSQVRTTPANPTVRNVRDLWWGAGGAGYYNSSSPPIDTTEATMSAYFSGLPDNNFGKQIAVDSTWARGYGLVSATYEGGPQAGGNELGGNSTDTVLSATYNADPRMKDRMLAAHGIYEANGGQFSTYYVYSGAAAWSFVNDLNPGIVADTTSVKMQVLDALAVRPKNNPTLGRLAPAVINLRTSSSATVSTGGANATWGTSGQAFRLTASPINEPGLADSVLFPVRSGGAKSFTVGITTYNAPAGGQVEVLLNGQSVGVINLTASTSGTAVVSPYLGPANFNNGLNHIRLRSLSGQIWVKEVVVR